MNARVWRMWMNEYEYTQQQGDCLCMRECVHVCSPSVHACVIQRRTHTWAHTCVDVNMCDDTHWKQNKNKTIDRLPVSIQYQSSSSCDALRYNAQSSNVPIPSIWRSNFRQ